jgi:serine/threonine protein kinase
VRQPIPFGKYVLLERISVGGMAEVFKAKSFGVEGFEKILAIKRILPSMAEDADFIEMFIDEAKICGQLNHANICQIFELGRVGESHFIAMEYVWGKDVLQIQNRFRKLRQTMKPEMAAFIASKLCEGLDYAHKKKDAAGRPLGIIHRDISPQNILISYDGELKIIDFGIAKAASRSSKTQAGVLKGKFGYMSPEQVRGLPLDRRSDVFAIGTILYELLTSDRLFMGESDFETLEKVRNVAIPPVTTINKNVPPDLERIISKALSKDVENRYQWANEMQEELQAFLVAREPVFTAKLLSSWMREQFALEMKREQQVLDEQRKIGREVLAVVAPAQPLAAVASSSLPVQSPLVAPSVSDFSHATNELSGDDLDAMMAMAEGDEDDLVGEKTTVAPQAFAATDPVGLPALPTQILATEAGGAAQVKAAGETSVKSPSPGELPQLSTVILEGGTGATQMPAAVHGAVVAGPNAKTMLEAPAPVIPPQRQNGTATPSTVILSGQMAPQPKVDVSGLRTPATGSVLAPPPYAHGHRSTLWKDIAIGIGVAVAVVGGVLGIRALLTRTAKGTLVVMVNASRAADVLVDGALKGHADPGTPLTLREIVAGTHAVVVRTGDGAEFRAQVALAANDVSVLTAVPRLPGGAAATNSNTSANANPNANANANASTNANANANAPPPSGLAVAPPSTQPGTGNLKLNLLSEGAQVYVDGAQLADGAWKDPIPLRADVPHEIRVTKPGREEVKLSVTLRASETVQRDVELLPAYGRVTVSSDPPGADVSVNGKSSGVTPLTVGDLDPGKATRVTLRLKGYTTATKYVSFGRGLVQALEFKLVPAATGSEAQTLEAAHPPVASEPKEVKVASAGKGITAPSPTENGFLVANTQPWAKVFIDGKDTGKTTPIAPRSKIALKPGKHVVTFVANGKKFNFDVTIKPAEDTRLIKQLADTAQ